MLLSLECSVCLCVACNEAREEGKEFCHVLSGSESRAATSFAGATLYLGHPCPSSSSFPPFFFFPFLLCVQSMQSV